MKYALNIDSETNAVLSATYEQFAWEGCVIVDHLPEGDITDYDYIDGDYVLNEERKAEREAAEEAVESEATEADYLAALERFGVTDEQS